MEVQGLPNEERGAAEEAEWPMGMPTAGEETTTVGDHKRACGGGEGGRKREGGGGEMGHGGERGHRERGAAEKAECPTVMPAAGEGWWRSEIMKGLAKEGRPAEKERATEEKWVVEERGATEEAAWPTGMPVAGEGTVAIGDRERPYGGGGMVEKERATEERGAVEERGAIEERGAMEEAMWPTGMSTGREGMVALRDRERPYGGGRAAEK